MTKICYFINSDWYFDLHWLERALSAKNAGYDVCVITRFHGDEFLKKFNDLGLQCFPLPLQERSYNLFGFISSALKTFRILSKINPSIIHCVTIKPIIIGGVYSRFRQTPMVANIVGLGRVFEPRRWYEKVLRKLVCLLYSTIFSNPRSHIVFEHQDDLAVFRRYVKFNQHHASVIDGCGVDTHLYGYSEEAENEIPVVFFASRMLHNKGLSALINIRKKMVDEGLPFRLWVAGILVDDDPDAIRVNEIERWHSAGDIEWLGTRKDIDSLISQANVVALPTMYPEGVPRILLEAASKGRACIAYDSGGCKSIIVDSMTGYLVRKGDEERFGTQLKKLLISPELRQKMGRNGRNLVIEKFSSSGVIDKTMHVYKNIL